VKKLIGVIKSNSPPWGQVVLTYSTIHGEKYFVVIFDETILVVCDCKANWAQFFMTK